MEVYFKILPQEKLIIERYYGEFNIIDYEKIKEQEYANSDFKPYFNLLIDLRNAGSTAQNPPDIVAKSIAEYLKAHPEKVGKRRTAFLTNEPYQVVNTILYSDIVKATLPISVNRFSTVQGAMDWLGVNDREIVLKEIEKLL